MNIFNVDGPFFHFLNRMADLCVLNFLFLLLCLPIVTVGTSCTALYTVTLKMSRNQEGYIVRSFFKAFKENFRQSTILWIPSVLILFTMLADIRIFSASENAAYRPLLVGAYIFLILVLFILSYAFPLLAKFQNTIAGTIKNAFLMGLASFPWTVCILLILFVPAIITLMLPKSLSFIYMFWLLFGFSLTALCTSYIFDFKVFTKYTRNN